MKIAVMGTGGMGGLYGGRLAQAGNDVTFIARGENLRAIQSNGLELTGPSGDVEVKAKATDDASTIGPVDLVLFCVKLFDTEVAARAIKPLLSKGGVVMPLQNGVDGWERIAEIVGKDSVMPGIALASATLESPGVVRYNSKAATLKFGELDGPTSERATRIRDACTAAGINTEVVPDIRAALWHKFVGLAVNSSLTSLTRKPAGVCYSDPDIAELAKQGFAEAAAVAKALGIKLQDDIVEWQLQNHRNFPPEMFASMYHDLARGKRMEVEHLSGLIVRKGKELGVPTPYHAFAYAALKPYMNGA